MARTKTRRRSTYEIVDEVSGRSFGVDIEPFDSIDPIVKILPDGRAVVGYASHDEDCSAPLKIGRDKYEPDGSGEFISMERGNGKTKGLAEFNRDEYGDPYDPDEPVAGNPYAVLLDKREHGLVEWKVIADPYDDDDFRRADGVWIPDDCCLEHIESSAIEGLLPEGYSVNYESKNKPDGTCFTRPPKEGEKPYLRCGQMVDERFSNVIMVTLPDGTKYPGFDTGEPMFKTFKAAYEWIAEKLNIKMDKEALKKGRRAVAVKCAEEAMEEFTKWCNGDCYGHVVIAFDQNDQPLEGDNMEYEDSCWGYIGSEYAEEQVADEVESMVNYLLKKTAPPPLTSKRARRKIIRGFVKRPA